MPPKPPKTYNHSRQEEESEDDVIIEEPMMDPNDPMRKFLPASFGKQKESVDVGRQFEQTKRTVGPIPTQKSEKPKQKTIGPAIPGAGSNSASDDDDDDDDDSEDDEDEFAKLPITHELAFNPPPHNRPITSISLDPTGTRLITASHDSSLKLFDLPTLSAREPRAFRTIEASDPHHIHGAYFSPGGQNILVVPAATQAKILSRDGETLTEFVKGDMYLRDMHNTKGHVSEITAGCWHPTDRETIVTAGTDSTIRIWDINNKRSHKEVIVYHSKTAKGGRSRMCGVAWSPGSGEGGSMIASVAMDGTLVVYSGSGPYNRPTMEARDAHERESWTGGIAFSPDGRTIVTGGADGFVKLWDTRKIKTPLMKREFNFASISETSLSFSPSGEFLLAGDITGNLHLLSPATLRIEKLVPVFTAASATTQPTAEKKDKPPQPTALTTAIWHPQLNQLLLGGASGALSILYSPEFSVRGAILAVARAPRKRHIDDFDSTSLDPNNPYANISEDAIILPNALLPTGGSASASSGRNAKNRGNTKMPQMPPQTPWGKNDPDLRHVREQFGDLVGMRDEDPREALLKYAEVAEREPMFTSAWKETQPKTIYAAVSDDEEEDDANKKNKRLKR